ncbi:MAG: alkaline phosphatase family protein [Thermodesulfobacteriota bacterium]
MPSKCVLIVLDGLADRSFAVLGHRTPLEAASTPNLDALAFLGATGLYQADRVGVPLSSQDAHFAMYGYESHERPKRGILEAQAAGVPVGPEDVSVLARLVAASEERGLLRIVDRRPPAKHEELAELMAEVEAYESEGIRFRFTQVSLHEGILVLSGSVSPRVTDTDPLVNGMLMPKPKAWAEAAGDETALDTARALGQYLQWVYLRLRGHPVNRAREERGAAPINMFITHLADRWRPMEPFRDRWGFTGLSISPKLVQWGVASSIGMDSVRVRDSQDPAADIADRISMAAEKLSSYDFVHVHSMAPDQAGHTKNPLTKAKVIEALDRGIGRSVDTLLHDPEALVIITADHATPSGGPLIHSGETVPLILLGEGVRRDKVTRFNEVECACGSLGQIRGQELMLLVVNHLDRAILRGIRHAPELRAYWHPCVYEPFRVDE